MIQLTGKQIPEHLLFVHLKVVVEGIVFLKRFVALSNLKYQYAWDRRNAYLEKVYGIADVVGKSLEFLCRCVCMCLCVCTCSCVVILCVVVLCVFVGVCVHFFCIFFVFLYVHMCAFTCDFTFVLEHKENNCSLFA